MSKDEILRAVTKDGYAKISAISARGMVQRAREIHDLSPTAGTALGRTLCAASLLGELMKEEDASLTVRVNGGGPIGSVIAVSDCGGNARGFVTNPHADLPLRADGKLDVGGVVGKNGMFTVSRDIGLKEPYVGSVELVTGEIAEDLTEYMVESEQVPAAFIEEEKNVAIEKTKAEQVQKAAEAALRKAGLNPNHFDSEEHIASNITKGWITAEEAEKGKAIMAEAAEKKAASLPQQMIDNIVNGRINKYYKENVLLAINRGEKKGLLVIAFRRVNLNED